MKYSSQSALKIARQIRDRFGPRIARATEGTPVPPKFVAALISVEAGKDRNGRIKEDATRFEPHVYAKLKAVRDGHLPRYNRIRHAQLKDATDEALKALAKSYSLTQVMGWWTFHLGGTVAELRDPEKHLGYAVKLLMLNSQDGDFERKEYVGEFREWNSGNEKGKTHDPDYVHNAGAVMDAYESLGDVAPEPVAPEPIEPEPAKPEPPTVVPAPPAPIEPKGDSQSKVSVQKVAQSLGSKIMAPGTLASGILTAIGAAFMGIIDNPFAFTLLILGVTAAVVFMWNESKKRQLQLQLDLNAKAASQDMNTVVVKPPADN